MELCEHGIEETEYCAPCILNLSQNIVLGDKSSKYIYCECTMVGKTENELLSMLNSCLDKALDLEQLSVEDIPSDTIDGETDCPSCGGKLCYRIIGGFGHLLVTCDNCITYAHRLQKHES